MKSIIRTVLLGGLAMLALSGVATASASAAECPGTGEGLELCSGGHVLEGTFAFTSTKMPGTSAYLKNEIVYLACESSKGTGQLVATKGKVEITKYSIEWTAGCRWPAFSKCKVREPIAYSAQGTGLHGVLATKGEFDETNLIPGEKEKIAEILVTGCEEEIDSWVKGAQIVKFPHGITSEATGHKIEWLPQGSSLTFEGKPAVIEDTEEIKLTSGKAFSLQHG